MRKEFRKSLADKVDPRHTALLVVDVQNDFCASGGYFTKLGHDVTAVQVMVPRLADFIEEARKVKLPVVFIQAIYDEYHLSSVWLEKKLGRPVSPHHCISGTWGADFYLLQPKPGEPIVQKHRYSAFLDTNLDLVLRSMGIESVLMAGVATNVCVESTARDAFQRDYYVLFLDDCTATTSEELHQGTLANIRRYFGYVVTSASVVAAWQETGVYQRSPTLAPSETVSS